MFGSQISLLSPANPYSARQVWQNFSDPFHRGTRGFCTVKLVLFDFNKSSPSIGLISEHTQLVRGGQAKKTNHIQIHHLGIVLWYYWVLWIIGNGNLCFKTPKSTFSAAWGSCSQTLNKKTKDTNEWNSFWIVHGLNVTTPQKLNTAHLTSSWAKADPSHNIHTSDPLTKKNPKYTMTTCLTTCSLLSSTYGCFPMLRAVFSSSCFLH